MKEVNPVKLTVDGKAVTDAIVIEGKSYLPIKQAMEMLGHKVVWNNTTKTVEVITKKGCDCCEGKN